MCSIKTVGISQAINNPGALYRTDFVGQKIINLMIRLDS